MIQTDIMLVQNNPPSHCVQSVQIIANIFISSTNRKTKKYYPILAHLN